MMTSAEAAELPFPRARSTAAAAYEMILRHAARSRDVRHASRRLIYIVSAFCHACSARHCLAAAIEAGDFKQCLFTFGRCLHAGRTIMMGAGPSSTLCALPASLLVPPARVHDAPDYVSMMFLSSAILAGRSMPGDASTSERFVSRRRRLLLPSILASSKCRFADYDTIAGGREVSADYVALTRPKCSMLATGLLRRISDVSSAMVAAGFR